MRILNDTLAVFWRFPDSPQQFHADMAKLFPGEPARFVVARFRQMFPRDVICSVRDRSGRFVAYKH